MGKIENTKKVMKRPRISLASFLGLDITIALFLVFYWGDLPREFAFSVLSAVIFSIIGQVGQITKDGPQEAFKAVLQAMDFLKGKGAAPEDAMAQIENFIVLALEKWEMFRASNGRPGGGR